MTPAHIYSRQTSKWHSFPPDPSWKLLSSQPSIIPNIKCKSRALVSIIIWVNLPKDYILVHWVLPEDTRLQTTGLPKSKTGEGNKCFHHRKLKVSCQTLQSPGHFLPKCTSCSPIWLQVCYGPSSVWACGWCFSSCSTSHPCCTWGHLIPGFKAWGDMSILLVGQFGSLSAVCMYRLTDRRV